MSTRGLLDSVIKNPDTINQSGLISARNQPILQISYTTDHQFLYGHGGIPDLPRLADLLTRSL
jgi:hypothetical protein